jgi:aspartate 4-decarboxylase
VDEKAIEQGLEKLGAFEVSNEMLKLASNNEKENTFLNAGRGNPNWINTLARLAFARLIQFGVKESARTISDGTLAGYTQLDGIRERFETFLDGRTNTEDQFLSDAVDYAHKTWGFPKDAFVKELVDGVIGNNYPVPSRVLKYSETVINAYLEQTLYRGEHLAETTDVFPVEGGTAAIVYIFNSLKENGLIKKGDKIALNSPIFTPYIQIPELNDYKMVEVDLSSKEENNWQISADELDKLKDPEIKALFIVNPSNPGSVAFDDKALEEIQKVVTEHPDLIIITDDVYGTFVDDFKTVYAVAPHNTLLVYSYSKLYGATGWRIGLIAVNKENVFDRLISELPEREKHILTKRYSINVLEPDKMKFIDRLVADSRAVGLYHTSGLSTPQQIMEVLFSFTHLLAGSKDDYIEASKGLVRRRYGILFKHLHLPENNDPHNAKYYSLIDIYQMAESEYDKAFRDWFESQFEQIDFLYKLSKDNGVVLMDGVGFGAKPGILRISEANLTDEDYEIIPKQILSLLADYHDQFLSQQ